jgi:hypothetical protein
MQNLHYGLIMLMMLLNPVTSAKAAQVSIGIGLPNVSIGINLPMLPDLVPVPGYPVYYAPSLDSNYFFYDGMYWVYQDDNWYASTWYNGPWSLVGSDVVPLFILRIPVRYYRQPPVYFSGWQANAAPRWGQHWGRDWELSRSGWNNWKRSAVPARAPRPTYQRQYTGDRYPRAEQQRVLRSQSYRYQPRDKAVSQHLRQQAAPKTPAAEQQRNRQDAAPAQRQQQNIQREAPRQQGAPASEHTQPPQRGGENANRSAPAQTAPRQQAPAERERQQPPAQREQQQPPAARGQDRGQEQRSQERGGQQEQNRGGGQGQRNEDDRGRGR